MRNFWCYRVIRRNGIRKCFVSAMRNLALLGVFRHVLLSFAAFALRCAPNTSSIIRSSFTGLISRIFLQGFLQDLLEVFFLEFLQGLLKEFLQEFVVEFLQKFFFSNVPNAPRPYNFFFLNI